MIENPPISGEKIAYGCKKCGHKFTRMRHWCDYGYRGLDCGICSEAYFVDCDEDPVFKMMEELSKKQFPSHKVKAPFDQDPEIQWFEREFEKTCDPCECGGNLKFAKGEMDLRCPECESSDLKIIRVTKKYVAGELKIKWVTHKNWEARNRGTKGQ